MLIANSSENYKNNEPQNCIAFSRKKIPTFFSYGRGGPINMQSIAAEEQNVKMELTQWDSRSILGIQSLQSQCKSDLFWGCSKQQPNGMGSTILRAVTKEQAI